MLMETRPKFAKLMKVLKSLSESNGAIDESRSPCINEGIMFLAFLIRPRAQ